MKNLGFSQFKRDAKTGGIQMQLLERYGQAVNEPPAQIKSVHTKSVVLLKGGKESWLPIDFASLFTYDGNYVYIYNAGLRPLTAEEQGVMQGWKQVTETPFYKKHAEHDMLTDGNVTYEAEKKFFMASKYPYLFGAGNKSAKRLKHTPMGDIISDATIKGDCILKYRVVKAR